MTRLLAAREDRKLEQLLKLSGQDLLLLGDPEHFTFEVRDTATRRAEPGKMCLTRKLLALEYALSSTVASEVG